MLTETLFTSPLRKAFNFEHFPTEVVFRPIPWESLSGASYPAKAPASCVVASRLTAWEHQADYRFSATAARFLSVPDS